MSGKRRSQKPRILVVDDHDAQRALVKHFLKKAGFDDVVEATDGQQALKVLAISEPALVITDIEMPRLGGVELVKMIRKTNPTIPVIMLTVHAEKSNVVAAISAGTNDYILKPLIDPELLVAKIEKLTDTSPHRSSSAE